MVHLMPDLQNDGEGESPGGRINPQDSRKRVYRLVSPEEAVKGMGKTEAGK
jgi:hypothetical protein